MVRCFGINKNDYAKGLSISEIIDLKLQSLQREGYNILNLGTIMSNDEDQEIIITADIADKDMYRIINNQTVDKVLQECEESSIYDPNYFEKIAFDALNSILYPEVELYGKVLYKYSHLHENTIARIYEYKGKYYIAVIHKSMVAEIIPQEKCILFREINTTRSIH